LKLESSCACHFMHGLRKGNVADDEFIQGRRQIVVNNFAVATTRMACAKPARPLWRCVLDAFNSRRQRQAGRLILQSLCNPGSRLEDDFYLESSNAVLWGSEKRSGIAGTPSVCCRRRARRVPPPSYAVPLFSVP